MRNLLLLVGCLSLFASTYTALLPVFADRTLHGGPRAMGLLMGAAGAGALVGALALGLGRPQGTPRWVGSAAVLFGGSLLAFSFSHSLPLSALLMALVGCGFMIATATINTLIQMSVPDACRGRVMSLYTVMFLGMVPLGGLLVGRTAPFLSAQAAVALAGTGALLAGILFAFSLAGEFAAASAPALGRFLPSTISPLPEHAGLRP